MERSRPDASVPAATLAPVESLIYHLGQLLQGASLPYQLRVQERLRSHVLMQLLCCTRHTITGLLCTAGRQQQDWSAHYRLYQRTSPDALFAVLRQELLRYSPPEQQLILALDDTVMKKRGRKIPMSGWRVDPLSPPFALNFLWGQRWLMVSGALDLGEGVLRMIPLEYLPCPTPQKPGRPADAQTQAHYRLLRQASNINLRALDYLRLLREQTRRRLCLLTDGRFANRTLLQGLPGGCELICRIRADAALFAAPLSPPAPTGRPRLYGAALPTPEQIRQDEQNYPYQQVRVFAAGRWHEMKVKLLRQVKWKAAGGHRSFSLVIIAPLGYRLSQGGRLLYRKPAYLLCSDNALDLQQIVQRYVGRWDVEVNIRDSKSVIGAGEAMLRHPLSARTAPRLRVAGYSLLLLAAARCFGPTALPEAVPEPKWRRRLGPLRASTNRLLNHLRYEVFSQGYWHEAFGDFWNSLQPQAPGALAHNATKPLFDPNYPLFHVIAA